MNGSGSGVRRETQDVAIDRTHRVGSIRADIAECVMDAANNGAFVSKASMESFLNTLGNAMNGVWSAVWNSSTGKYDFSFTPNAALQNENLNND